MDCREFENKHVAYVDDLLSAREMDAMRRHIGTCSRCSRQDVRVRRSLMLVRSLPPIEPSPDFFNKLNARLAELGPEARVDAVPQRSLFPSMLPSMASFAALAAGIVAVAYMAVETNNYFAPATDQRLSAVGTVVAMPIADSEPMRVATPMPMSNAALVASVPTGISVWPAVLMAGQSPMHFAAAVETR